MRRRNREINIFSLSAMDLFASATGVFVLLTLILLPYYLKESPPDLSKQLTDSQALTERQRQALQEQQKALEQAQNDLRQLRQRANTAEQKLARTFLVIYIRWAEMNHDVDLHVVNPAGVEFYFQHKTDPHHLGELTEDSMLGPGNELWELHNAPPGVYRVYANLYNRHGNAETSEVRGRVIYRDGGGDLNTVRLSREGRKVQMATITVSDQGNVTIE
ncbi:MAG: hypothetical protein Kow0065_08370 [Methylomicrobium sp.]